MVHATAQDKQAIAAKAKRLELPMNELVWRGTFAYESSDGDAELSALDDAARSPVERAKAAIDDALSFIEASNRRIAAMDAMAARRAARKAA